MKRINNDDVLAAMVYASQEKKALAAEAAGAMSRMEARCSSALRFLGGGTESTPAPGVGARNKMRGSQNAYHDER